MTNSHRSTVSPTFGASRCSTAPFCDRWEHRDQPVVVIDAAPGAYHLADIVRSWTSHVTVVAASDIAALIGEGSTLTHVALRNGRSIAATAAFVKAAVVPRSSIASALGEGFGVGGLTILERRPPWSELIGSEWTRAPIARLTYSKQAGAWTLYYADRNDRFQRYWECGPSSHVTELLEEIDTDPICTFWG